VQSALMDSYDSRNPLDGVDWGNVYAQAVVVVLRFVPSQDAEDVVMEGMKRVIEGSSPWNPDGGRSLVAHVVAVGLNERRNVRRKAQRRNEPEFVEAVAYESEAGRPGSPEEEAADGEERERKARLYGKLVALCAGDAGALAVLECEQAGICEPVEQVREGLDIEGVRNARKRIKRRIEMLSDADDEEEAAS
jgi:hypothetical protein